MVKKTRDTKNWRKYWGKIYQSATGSIKRPGYSKKGLPKEESPHHPEIYIFRHGETFDNCNKVYSGHRDSQLTSKGIAQAKILNKKLKGKDIDICIISSLSRSKQTAEIGLEGHLDVKFEVDDRVIERDYGDLAGTSKEKDLREDMEKAIFYRRGYDVEVPGGENIKQVEERVFPFCDELVERVKKHNVNVAISAHGNSMRALRTYFENMGILERLTHENPLGQDYCEYVIK